MAFLGLVPSERTTGDTVRRGSITKTGNSAIVERDASSSRPRGPTDILLGSAKPVVARRADRDGGALE
jgi:Transposase IS116/IS110/IS902 family